MKYKAFLIGYIIGLIFMMCILFLKEQNDNLIKENGELKQDIIDYKWQLSEVPNIVESVKEEICK